MNDQNNMQNQNMMPQTMGLPDMPAPGSIPEMPQQMAMPQQQPMMPQQMAMPQQQPMMQQQMPQQQMAMPQQQPMMQQQMPQQQMAMPQQQMAMPQQQPMMPQQMPQQQMAMPQQQPMMQQQMPQQQMVPTQMATPVTPVQMTDPSQPMGMPGQTVAAPPAEEKPPIDYSLDTSALKFVFIYAITFVLTFLLGGNIFPIVGVVISLICTVLVIPKVIKKTRLAWLVLLVGIGAIAYNGYYAATSVLGFGGITEEEQTAFVNVAKDYLSAAKNEYSEQNCNARVNEENVKLANITSATYKGEKVIKAPINTEASYVNIVMLQDEEGTCLGEYKIYMTDGTYAIGKSDDPASEDSVTLSNIIKLQ